MFFQIDQPSFGLPREFYEDPATYAEYVDAYKTYIVDVARVMSREAGQNVPDAMLMVAADNVFDFESQLALVSKKLIAIKLTNNIFGLGQCADSRLVSLRASYAGGRGSIPRQGDRSTVLET